MPMFSGEWNRTAADDTHTGLLNLGHSSARVSKQNVMTSDTGDSTTPGDTGLRLTVVPYEPRSYLPAWRQQGTGKEVLLQKEPWHVTFQFISKK